MQRDVCVLYTRFMPEPSLHITALITARNDARLTFFAHRDPGDLTPAEKRAFKYRNMAFLLLLKAAQMELEAETEMEALISLEQTA